MDRQHDMGEGLLMKNGKKPTMAQKIRLKSLKLVPDNWLISKCSPAELVVVHQVSGEVRRLGS